MKKNSLKLSILLVLVVTALWFIGSWWHYTCHIKNTCGKETLADQDTPAKTDIKKAIVAAAPAISSETAKDTDNDGLTDEEEATAGTDPLLVDTDGDSIPDNEEIGANVFKPLDTDNDGIIDALDMDDDNDATSTLIEEKIGTSSLLADTDGDGLSDTDEIGKNPEKPIDTDSDGIINALDTDDDDDNLDTSTEIILGTNPLLADTDGDGLSDGDEIGDLMDKPIDKDSDGIIDALDTEDNLDQDGDGLSDELEAQLNTNPKKKDTDGDGINDAEEVGENTASPLDSDLDGTIDALDTVDDSDQDNDGLSDAQEEKLGSNPKEVDSDKDGINDNQEIGSNIDSPLDTDEDGILNLIDPDDDNDGLATQYEIEIGTNPLLTDSDADGLSDKAELTVLDNDKIKDTDNDGKIDPVDADDDNDGLMTSLELALKSNPLSSDTDGDGISDDKEVGSDTKNPLDSDNDGIPDILDNTDDSQQAEAKPEPVPEPTKEPGEAKTEEATPDKDTLTVEAIEGTHSDAFQASRLYFPTSSSKPVMSDDASEYFDKVIAWMTKSPNNMVNLIGHTDSTGDAQANLALGIRRVMVIREMLIDKGAPLAQLDIMSRGESQPIADNTTKFGRLKNRRVEIAPAK